MRLLPLARGGELILTRAVAADPGVAALLLARGLEGEVLQGDSTAQGQVLLRLKASTNPLIRDEPEER